MNFLLDTNVVSEWVKPRPNLGVIRWLEEIDEDRTFISVVTPAELRYGIERMAAGAHRKRLEDWLQDELPVRFEGRILPVDGPVADAWGKIVAHTEAVGRRINAMDGLIAATAQVHGLTLVTRNAMDFESSVKALVNPWIEM